jgi:hypothetical protein
MLGEKRVGAAGRHQGADHSVPIENSQKLDSGEFDITPPDNETDENADAFRLSRQSEHSCENSVVKPRFLELPEQVRQPQLLTRSGPGRSATRSGRSAAPSASKLESITSSALTSFQL